MASQPLHYVWQYTEVDRRFWREHLEDWLPSRLFDAHTHVMDARFRLQPMTQEMRRQHWVNEVFEPIPLSELRRCYTMLFPGREVAGLAFGMPDLDHDLAGGNQYVQRETSSCGWFSLAVTPPQWDAPTIEHLLRQPGVLGLKPYYTLISQDRATRDAHLEADIFDFLPHQALEVLNHYHAWVTLHVPKADRLGHPANLRQIRELRQRYPQVRLVIAHLGRSYTEPHAREGLAPFTDDPGLFFDTAAVLNPASHRVALELLGPERVLYGSDNPIMFMRGRRRYRDRAYVNYTNYPFYFNRDREPPEVEAQYTLFMYEDLRAIRQACDDLQLRDPRVLNRIFHANAAGLIAGILRRKQELGVPLHPEPGS